MTSIAMRPQWLAGINTGRHRAALNLFLVIVLAHWAEHVAQAMQILHRRRASGRRPVGSCDCADARG